MYGKGSRAGFRKKRILVVEVVAVAVAVLLAGTYYYVPFPRTHSGVGVPAPQVSPWNNSTKVVNGKTTYYVTFVIDAGWLDIEGGSLNASQWNWSFYSVNVYSVNNSTKTPILPSPTPCTSNPPGMMACAAPAVGWYLVISDRNWNWIASYPEASGSAAWYGHPSGALGSGNLLTIVSPNLLAGGDYQLLWHLDFLVDNNSYGGGIVLNNPYNNNP